MTTSRQVLVIDGHSDTATVLEAILERGGTRVEHARTQRVPRSWSEETCPDVVVVDVDSSPTTAVDESRTWADTPHVVISSQRITVDDSNTRFLQKPFQFPELIRAVQDLLDAPR